MSAEAGYLFYPSRYRPAIGHEKLDVFLSPAPTGRVFDCAGFYLRARADEWATPTTISLVHNAEMPARSYHVTPGRFWLYDFGGHSLEGFSFGGNLIAVCQNGQTVCSLESNAPILELDPDSYDVERIFVDAVEAIAGVLRAEWRDDGDAEWLSNLASVEPLALFVSCLVTVQASLNDGGHDGDSMRLKTWIRRAIRSLRNAGEWPEQTPTLSQLEQALSQAQKPPDLPDDSAIRL
jgi:hypothetical protein